MAKHLVFVYGTLKKSLPNHPLLCEEQKGKAIFIGDGKTKEKYPLVIASEYHIPCLLYEKDRGHCIKGEVYKVDDKMLESLDELEEHPEFYERLQERVILHSDTEQEITPWIYFIKKFNPSLLNEPMISDYQNDDEDKLYIPRYLRNKCNPKTVVLR